MPVTFAPEHDLAAVGLDVAGVGARHLAVVDDAGARRMQRHDPGRVRLDLEQPLAVDLLEARDAVRDAAAVQLFETRQLFFAGRHDDFAAQVVLDALGVAKLEQRLHARDAVLRLERPRRVVDAGVDHAAVVPRLVLRQRVLFVDDADLVARVLLRDLHRRSYADDAATDDRDVVVVRGHGRLLRSRASVLWFRLCDAASAGAISRRPSRLDPAEIAFAKTRASAWPKHGRVGCDHMRLTRGSHSKQRLC